MASKVEFIKMSPREFAKLADQHCGICTLCFSVNWNDMGKNDINGRCDVCGRSAVIGMDTAMYLNVVKITQDDQLIV